MKDLKIKSFKFYKLYIFYFFRILEKWISKVENHKINDRKVYKIYVTF